MTSTQSFEPYSHEESLRQYEEGFSTNLKSGIPFLCDEMPLHITDGIIGIAAQSGSGKTTLKAGLIARELERNEHAKPMLISNEDRPTDSRDRISCAMLELDFIDYKQGRLSPEVERQVRDLSRSLIKRVHLARGPRCNTGCLEDVIAVFDYVKRDPSITSVYLDYHQRVDSSRDDSSIPPVTVHKKLGSHLTDFAVDSRIPVYLFTQLVAPDSTHGRDARPFQNRIYNDHSLYHCLSYAIEVQVDRSRATTDFVIQKCRMGDFQEKVLRTSFCKGTYKFLSFGLPDKRRKGD